MRHWEKVRTVTAAGRLMADWLDGRTPQRPGYTARRPDPETTSRMARTLAAINRAGYITTDSQPGSDEMVPDNEASTHWVQRAAVHGYIADENLLSTIRDAARRTGLMVVADGQPVVVTWVDGRAYTAFGGALSRGNVRREWYGTGRAVVRELQSAHQVAAIDPHRGPSDRLWDMLDQVARRYG